MLTRLLSLALSWCLLVSSDDRCIYRRSDQPDGSFQSLVRLSSQRSCRSTIASNDVPPSALISGRTSGWWLWECPDRRYPHDSSQLQRALVVRTETIHSADPTKTLHRLLQRRKWFIEPFPIHRPGLLLATTRASQLCRSIHARVSVQTSSSSRCLDLHDQFGVERFWKRLRSNKNLSNVSISFITLLSVGRRLSISSLQLYDGFHTPWLGTDSSRPSDAFTRRFTRDQRQTIHHGLIRWSLEPKRICISHCFFSHFCVRVCSCAAFAVVIRQNARLVLYFYSVC